MSWSRHNLTRMRTFSQHDCSKGHGFFLICSSCKLVCLQTSHKPVPSNNQCWLVHHSHSMKTTYCGWHPSHSSSPSILWCWEWEGTPTEKCSAVNSMCGLQVQLPSEDPSLPTRLLYLLCTHIWQTKQQCFFQPALVLQLNGIIFHLFNNKNGKKTIIHFSINVFVFLFSIQKSRTWQSRSFLGNEPVKNKLCEI